MNNKSFPTHGWVDDKAIRLLFNDQKSPLDVVCCNNKIMVLLPLKSTNRENKARPFSVEGVAQRLKMSMDEFIQRYYIAGAMQSNKDHTKEWMTFLLHGGSLQEGQTAVINDILTCEIGRPLKLQSMCEFLLPGHPVAAFMDLDCLKDLEVGIKEDSSYTNTFVRAYKGCGPTRALRGDSGTGLALGSSSRQKGDDQFKISKHMVDPAIVFDSMATAKYYFNFIKEAVLKHFTNDIDLSVYREGGSFRLPLSMKFNDLTTKLHVVQGELQQFFVIQPKDTPTISLIELEERLPGFRTWRNKKISRPKQQTQQKQEQPETEDKIIQKVIQHLNAILKRQTSVSDWNVEVTDQFVFFKLAHGPCCVDTTHTHSTPYHSGFMFGRESAYLYLYCDSHDRHPKIPLSVEMYKDVSEAEQKKKMGDQHTHYTRTQAIRSALINLYGISSTSLVPDATAVCIRALFNLPEDTQVRRIQVSTKRWRLETDCPMLKSMDVVCNAYSDLITPEQISITCEPPRRFESASMHVPLLCLMMDKITGSPVEDPNYRDELTAWVNYALQMGHVYKKDDRFYIPDPQRRFILRDCGTEIGPYVESLIMTCAPPYIKQEFMRKGGHAQKDLYAGIEQRTCCFKPAILRNCWVFGNGLLDMPMSPHLDLEGMQRLFTRWEDLSADTSPFLPISETDLVYQPDMFTNREYTPSFNKILDHQLSTNPSVQKQVTLAMLGRAVVHFAWMHAGIGDQWQSNLIISGASSTGKSTLIEAILPFCWRGYAVIGGARAGGIGAYSHLKDHPLITQLELSGDPNDAMNRNMNDEFLKKLARNEPMSMDHLYRRSETVRLFSASLYSANYDPPGFEKSVHTFDAMWGLYRSHYTCSFRNTVSKADPSLPAKLTKEVGAFLCQILWQYLETRRQYPVLMTDCSHVRDSVVAKVQAMHPFAQYMKWTRDEGQQLVHEEGSFVTPAQFRDAVKRYREDQGLPALRMQEFNDDEISKVATLFSYETSRRRGYQCRTCLANEKRVVLFRGNGCHHYEEKLHQGAFIPKYSILDMRLYLKPADY